MNICEIEITVELNWIDLNSKYDWMHETNVAEIWNENFAWHRIENEKLIFNQDYQFQEWNNLESDSNLTK
jgi:hypothetical protein